MALSRRSGVPTIETGTGPGVQSHVKVFRLGDLALLASTELGDPAYLDGVYVG